MKKFYLSFTLLVFGYASLAQLKYLDKTFSNDGFAVTNFGSSAYLYSIAVQPDKKIVAAATYNYDFALVRYNEDGSPDNNFGTNGKVITDLGNYDYAQSVAVQGDGKIVVAGYSESGSGTNPASKIAVVRYNIDGSLDNNFGNGGKVFTTVKHRTFGYAMLLQPDGKIVVAGSTSVSGNDSYILLVRYNISGTPDNTFGKSGIVTSTFNFENEAQAVALQPDGKLLAAGFSYDGVSNSTNAILVRYKPNGKLDSSLLGKGYLLDYAGFFNAVTVQKDGKILLAGDGFNDNYDFFGFVQRRNTDGSVDMTYGNGGSLAGGYYSGFTSNLSAIVLQPDGKAIFSGIRTGDYPDHKTFTGVARLTAEGKADATFGDSGLVAISNKKIATNFRVVNPLALQTDGKILVGIQVNSGIGIARILPQNNVVTADAQQQNMLNIHAYPNPVAVNLIINGLNKNKPAVVTISDISGNIMQTQKIAAGTNSINVGALKSGHYIAVFTQDKQTGSVKFIKQ